MTTRATNYERYAEARGTTVAEVKRVAEDDFLFEDGDHEAWLDAVSYDVFASRMAVAFDEDADYDAMN